jgi:hypothetical protein
MSIEFKGSQLDYNLRHEIQGVFNRVSEYSYEIGITVEIIDITKDKVEVRAFDRHAGYAYKAFGEFAMNAEFKKFFMEMRSEDAKEKDADNDERKASAEKARQDKLWAEVFQERNSSYEGNGGTGIRL